MAIKRTKKGKYCIWTPKSEIKQYALIQSSLMNPSTLLTAFKSFKILSVVFESFLVDGAEKNEPSTEKSSSKSEGQ